MDPVSRSLAEIERHRPRLLPFVFLATGLHVALVGAVFIAGKHKPRPRVAHLPTVSVRLIRERPTQPKAASSQASSRPMVATPLPQPTTAPPTPVPQPTSVPKSRAERSEIPKASADAMPELGARSKPAPTTPPETDAVVSRGGGLSLGGGGESADSAVPSDFQFTYYLQRMLTLIESRWYKPPVPMGTAARARFTIMKGGRVVGIALEESSGNSSFDRAVLRALYAANPLPPLPPAYLKPNLTVHLRFANTE